MAAITIEEMNNVVLEATVELKRLQKRDENLANIVELAIAALNDETATLPKRTETALRFLRMADAI
jgi:hypothetical protein